MRRRFNAFGGPGAYRARRVVRRRVGMGLTANAVRRAALMRGIRYAGRALPYVGPAVVGYKALQMAKARLRHVSTRRQVGAPVNSNSTKKRLLEGSDTISTKTLNNGLRLLSIPKTTTFNEAELNTRQRNAVDFRGLKICFSIVQNTLGAALDAQKFFFNWAVVTPKQQSETVASLPSVEWFRGQTGARATDFTAANLTGLDCHCLPINTDKYIVHRHKRIRMGPFESTEGKSQRYFETYIPVKRQIRYNINGAGVALDYPEAKDMWMVYWCSYQDEATGAATASAMDVRFRIVQYFKEPKN